VEKLFVDPGLPDFSWYNIPNRWKIYHMATKLPNGSKIVPKVSNIFQGPPKFTQIVFFWFENIPSGNPV
jgi:hypothetical protein